MKRLERRAEKKGLEGRIRILKAEASSFKLENKSVDLVVSNFVLHELLNPKAVLLKTYRVLRPGGWIVITDFRKDTMLLDWGKNETHKRGKAGGL
jgi:ubiquinone/menaquinone biosynthesis C-methylase UbiE